MLGGRPRPGRRMERRGECGAAAAGARGWGGPRFGGRVAV